MSPGFLPFMGDFLYGYTERTHICAVFLSKRYEPVYPQCLIKQDGYRSTKGAEVYPPPDHVFCDPLRFFGSSVKLLHVCHIAYGYIGFSFLIFLQYLYHRLLGYGYAPSGIDPHGTVKEEGRSSVRRTLGIISRVYAIVVIAGIIYQMLWLWF